MGTISVHNFERLVRISEEETIDIYEETGISFMIWNQRKQE